MILSLHVISDVLHKKKDSSMLLTLFYHGNVERTDRKEIADAFNDFL